MRADQAWPVVKHDAVLGLANFKLATDAHKIALAHIASLFQVERLVAGSPHKKRREVRQEKSRPVVDAFFVWCEAEREHVLDESPVAEAMRYAINQKAALMRFLDDGSLPLHNNISELNLRREDLFRQVVLGQRT